MEVGVDMGTHADEFAAVVNDGAYQGIPQQSGKVVGPDLLDTLTFGKPEGLGAHNLAGDVGLPESAAGNLCYLYFIWDVKARQKSPLGAADIFEGPISKSIQYYAYLQINPAFVQHYRNESFLLLGKEIP